MHFLHKKKETEGYFFTSNGINTRKLVRRFKTEATLF